MYIKRLSDIDYGYNAINGKFDIPKVEWETSMGTFLESFDSEVERTLALDENEAYNNTAEVMAYIKAEDDAEDLWRAEVYTAEIFEYALEQSQTLALKDVLSFASAYGTVIINKIVNMVCVHNKLIMRARVQPVVSTYTIGDMF